MFCSGVFMAWGLVIYFVCIVCKRIVLHQYLMFVTWMFGRNIIGCIIIIELMEEEDMTIHTRADAKHSSTSSLPTRNTPTHKG